MIFIKYVLKTYFTPEHILLTTMPAPINRQLSGPRPVPRGTFELTSFHCHLNEDPEFPDRVDIHIRDTRRTRPFDYYLRLNSPYELELNCSKFELKTMMIACVHSYIANVMDENKWLTLEPDDSLYPEMRLNATFKYGANQFTFVLSYIVPTRIHRGDRRRSMRESIERDLAEMAEMNIVE